MSDIHQEWRELRQKNGDFICHLDGEVAKLKKEQVELKQDKQMQDLADAGAFAMQFVAPPPFNCCQDDRDILRGINNDLAKRNTQLEDQIAAYKEQLQVDLAVKKDLDEKLDKAAADYKALWVENTQLKERVTNCNNVNAALRQRNNELREIASSQYGLYSYHVQQGMQSKIAKQAAEIKRLTEENERLKHDNKALAKGFADQAKLSVDFLSGQKTLKHEIKTLQGALDIAAKDADANFERGEIKGMKEIWKELVDCYAGRPTGENQKIFGYYSVGDILMNLSPTWFMYKAREYHEQKEKEACDIKLGDEVEIFDQCDHSLSDIGIVIAMEKDEPCFAVIGPQFEACFTAIDINAGNVKKTGRHFDTIPLDYLA